MAVAQLPNDIITMMAKRDMRMHHYIWHEVRNGWNRYNDDIKNAIRALGWEPPRPALKVVGDRTRPIYDNDSGEDFLYMHRQMIASVNQRLHELADPDYPKVQGWSSIPAPDDADYPVPPAWDSGNPEMNTVLSIRKSTDFFQTTMHPQEQQYTNPDWLKTHTLGDFGANLEFTIHNNMHMRWCSEPSAIRPLEDPAHPDRIDARWDDPVYMWLGDTYASHVNPVFWKLHGWIDDRIEDWKRANNVVGEIVWKGTWLGPTMTPSPMIIRDHGGHAHGSNLDAALAVVLKSGVHCTFYDPTIETDWVPSP